MGIHLAYNESQKAYPPPSTFQTKVIPVRAIFLFIISAVKHRPHAVLALIQEKFGVDLLTAPPRGQAHKQESVEPAQTPAQKGRRTHSEVKISPRSSWETLYKSADTIVNK